MPGDPFKKVQAGERLEIPAEAWNAFLDAVRWVRQQQHSRDQEAGAEFRQTGIVKVKNQSGADRERFDILGVNAPIILPSENLQEFKNRVALVGVAPTTDHLGEFLILLEPLKAGAIGRGIVAGVSLARLLVNPAQLYGFAQVIPGNTHALRNVPAGSARVLWIESSGSSERWAVVRLDEGDYQAHVLITSNVPDDEGYYDGVVQRYDIATKTWQSLFPCKVLDINQ
ncbi:MAG: hypothetical protein KatS3mg082_1972 [Nitrospiraceae bacterium]|nr:MAG: hypothetical protein KatS3mg082_1972 [Nitrospiraceae bacterium]